MLFRFKSCLSRRPRNMSASSRSKTQPQLCASLKLFSRFVSTSCGSYPMSPGSLLAYRWHSQEWCKLLTTSYGEEQPLRICSHTLWSRVSLISKLLPIRIPKDWSDFVHVLPVRVWRHIHSKGERTCCTGFPNTGSSM
jgi:hypothetical protein